MRLDCKYCINFLLVFLLLLAVVMPREKDPIRDCFLVVQDVGSATNKGTATCRHCGKKYETVNVVRLKKHITSECQHVPRSIKTQFVEVPGQGSSSLASSSLESANEASRSQGKLLIV